MCHQTYNVSRYNSQGEIENNPGIFQMYSRQISIIIVNCKRIKSMHIRCQTIQFQEQNERDCVSLVYEDQTMTFKKQRFWSIQQIKKNRGCLQTWPFHVVYITIESTKVGVFLSISPSNLTYV